MYNYLVLFDVAVMLSFRQVGVSSLTTQPMPVNKPDPERDSLSEGEIWWRDHYKWLDERGYQLRPRLTPGWVPSWLGKDVWPRFCEDFETHIVTLFILSTSISITSHSTQNPLVQDAVRKDDNRRVMMKKINTKRHEHEQEIATYFSSKELADIPENHCVPIWEVMQVPDDNDIIILVMPLLRDCMSPAFETVGEVVEFLSQVFDVSVLRRLQIA